MKIIVESKIPYIQGVLESYGNVSYLDSEDITAETIADADALFVRTRNVCDKSLLEGSQCRFIASATIGLDHVDRDYCNAKGIKVVNAPGCNAPAVAQYVFCSIMQMYKDLKGKTIGIVGVGNIGSIVDRWARSLGMVTLLNDPPRQRTEKDDIFVTLDEIAEKSDIITIHAPLILEGVDKTFHLFNQEIITKFQKKPLVINAARGSITDSNALLEGMEKGKISDVILDCWENEPDINHVLLERAAISTPHIAGYSIEGKMRATRMVVDSFTKHFKFPSVKWESPISNSPDKITIDEALKSYDVLKDSYALKSNPESFENLRNHYLFRHEIGL
ncbi:MAG: 4-phosphoerythronate dehydrogenase [Paramuribaculum sp.]|nr:4-phosphoerythronate dehydrogenase [Paramuribaculum sp.]